MVFFSMSEIKKHMDSNPEQLDKPVMFTTISVALQVSIVWKTQAIWTTAVLPYLRFITTLQHLRTAATIWGLSLSVKKGLL